jgi:hypothetical protein
MSQSVKSAFDEGCDALRQLLRRLDRQDHQGRQTPDHISVSRDILEMLLEDHYDLQKEARK